jgi:cytoskeleton protein RodZ
MRQRIDIVEVESHTKIRAKYLRALENEEWDLLPGPTFVKTFLRTYGDYLGLDSKMLVEEYKQRFERPGPQDLLPFSPRSSSRRQPRARAVPPAAILAVTVLLLVGALYALGQFGGDGGDGNAAEVTATATATPAAEKPSSKKRKPKKAAAPTTVRLRIVPTGTVNVCLVSGVSGKVLVNSENLEAGNTTRLFAAKRLRVTFGNGQARMRVGSKSYDVPDSDQPVGYDLRPGRKPRVLSADARPACAA